MVTAVKKLIHQSPINEIKTVTKRFLFLKSKFPDFGLCNRRGDAPQLYFILDKSP